MARPLTLAAMLLTLAAGCGAPGSALAAPRKAPARPSVEAAMQDLDLGAVTEARGVVALIVPEARQDSYFRAPVDRIMDQLRANATRQGIDPGLRKVVEDFIDTVPARLQPVTDKHRPVLLDAMARAFAHDYSADELKQIRAFGETPTGARFLSTSQPQFTDATLAALQRNYVQDLADAAAKLRPELLEKVNGWIAANPPLAPSPAPPGKEPVGR